MITEVILVNGEDVATGRMEKLEAHQKGLLHRAFSIFIFNSRGQMLLQQRASNKYHNGGLWTNTCCSHPAPGESTHEAAQRRLKEEMGFSTELEKAFEFTYKASFDNGLTEHEFDHVYVGNYDGEILLNKAEAQDYCYRSMTELENLLKNNPEKFTAWFKIALPKLDVYRTMNTRV